MFLQSAKKTRIKTAIHLLLLHIFKGQHEWNDCLVLPDDINSMMSILIYLVVAAGFVKSMPSSI